MRLISILLELLLFSFGVKVVSLYKIVAESDSAMFGLRRLTDSVERRRVLYSAEDVMKLTADQRRLIGSNCIVIQRGEVPEYYDCIGCIVEEAQACIDDLRYNLTGTVGPHCSMNSMREFNTDANDCCPQFGKAYRDPWSYERYTDEQLEFIQVDMLVTGSAYPEAFVCLENAGCEESLVYTDLEIECQHRCEGPDGVTDPRFNDTTKGVCHATYNAASRGFGTSVQILFVSLVSILAVSISVAIE